MTDCVTHPVAAWRVTGHRGLVTGHRGLVTGQGTHAMWSWHQDQEMNPLWHTFIFPKLLSATNLYVTWWYSRLEAERTISTVTGVTCVCPTISRAPTNVLRGCHAPTVPSVRKTFIPPGKGLDAFTLYFSHVCWTKMMFFITQKMGQLFYKDRSSCLIICIFE